MKKSFLLILAIIGLAGLLNASELVVYPGPVVAELFADTTVPACEAVYTAIDQAHSSFAFQEFISLRYYSSHNNGDYGNTAADSAIADYGITAYPTVLINGATTEATSYTDEINAKLNKGGIFTISLTGFNPNNGNFDVSVTALIPPTIDIAIEADVRVLLVEDTVEGVHNKIVRAGQTQEFTFDASSLTTNMQSSFTLDDSWDVNELNLVVLVNQRDDNYTLMQSASTFVSQGTVLRAAIPFETDIVGPPTGRPGLEWESEYLTVVNYGDSASFDLGLLADDVPAGWTFTFCYKYSHGEAGCWNPVLGTMPVSLLRGEHILLNVHLLNIDNPGGFDFSFNFNSTDDRYTLSLPFSFRTEDYVDNEDNKLISKYSSLSISNSPNPFNPVTNLNLNIPNNDKNYPVTVAVYNLKGQKVKTLVNNTVINSDKQITWFGNDDTGNKVGSGVYFAVVKSKSGKAVSKMALLK